MIKMHDWLADTDLDVAKEKIVDIMQNSSKIDVPLSVEAGVGDNWDEAH